MAVKILSVTMEPLKDKLAVHITYPNHRETKFVQLGEVNIVADAAWDVIWRAVEEAAQEQQDG